MQAFNLATCEEITFDENTTALWAVCYGYCQEHNLLSALFSSAQESRFEQFADTLPLVYGNRSVEVGDWSAICN